MIDTLRSVLDEFYIGYEERMPRGIARRVVRAVVMFAGGAAAGVAVSLAAQQTLAPSRFEFGVVKPVAGVLRRDPYPSLQVDGRRVWLVAPGKFGADRILAGAPDGPVIVKGSAIERGSHRMLEITAFRARSESVRSTPRVLPESVQSASRDDSERTPGAVQSAVRPDSERTLNNPVRLSGEIVDSKCFLGVMNPGEGTVHRDCARRCLSGGIPPLLLVRDGGGREELVVLVSEDGHALGREIRSLAGRPVTVTGRLRRDQETWMLDVRTASYTP